MIKRTLYWKLPIVLIAILAMIFEVNSYSTTRFSIGELYLHFIEDNIMFVALGLIVLFLLLFFPIFDLEGVERSI